VRNQHRSSESGAIAVQKKAGFLDWKIWAQANGLKSTSSPQTIQSRGRSKQL
jgi:hypothetical protein